MCQLGLAYGHSPQSGSPWDGALRQGHASVKWLTQGWSEGESVSISVRVYVIESGVDPPGEDVGRLQVAANTVLISSSDSGRQRHSNLRGVSTYLEGRLVGCDGGKVVVPERPRVRCPLFSRKQGVRVPQEALHILTLLDTGASTTDKKSALTTRGGTNRIKEMTHKCSASSPRATLASLLTAQYF